MSTRLLGKQAAPMTKTCGFLIQLVFCEKRKQKRQQLAMPLHSGAPLPKKNPESAPATKHLEGHCITHLLICWSETKIS